MKVEFSCWDHAVSGSEFIVEMGYAPREGDILHMHIDMFPAAYFEGVFVDHPLLYDEHIKLVEVRVEIVIHEITKNGHLVRVDIEPED